MALFHSPRIVTSGLVLCLDAANTKSYPGSGTAWSDLSGNGNTGTLTNGPTYSSANNGAIIFDGVNDYINGETSFTSLDLIDKSFQCWIKINSSSQKGIIDKDFDNGGGNYGGWGFWIQSNNKLWWWNHANLDLLDDGPNTVSLTDWTNVAVTYNSTSKTATFYINGVLNSSKTNASIVEKSSSSSSLVIGTIRNAVSAFFSGSIAEVKSYSRVLTISEIRQNFNALRGRYGL